MPPPLPGAKTPGATTRGPRARLSGAAPRLAGAAALAGLDQATKAAALALLPRGESVPLLPFLSLTLHGNRGVAFGGLAWLGTPALLALTGAISLGFAAALALSGGAPPERRLGLAAIVGGALGNWLDRALRGGEVVDFVRLHAGGRSFPTFNAADALLTAGAAALVLEWLLAARRERAARRAGGAAAPGAPGGPAA